MNFVEWCRMRGVPAYPTQPRLLAQFIENNAKLGPDWAECVVNEIVAANLEVGLANPAATPAVIGALSALRAIDPPRSWPKDQWPHFAVLPLPTQRYLVERDTEVSKEVRRLQNQVADLKRKMREKEDGKAVA